MPMNANVPAVAMVKIMTRATSLTIPKAPNNAIPAMKRTYQTRIDAPNFFITPNGTTSLMISNIPDYTLLRPPR